MNPKFKKGKLSPDIEVFTYSRTFRGDELKIKKTTNGKTKIDIAQTDWLRIGERAGWLEKDFTKVAAKEFAPVKYNLETLPLDIRIDKYSDRTWAVYVNGNLLAVTLFRRGAEAVKDLLEQMIADLMQCFPDEAEENTAKDRV
jgi:hypothetical protein